MRAFLEQLLFYPAYCSLLLMGFFVHKRKTTLVTAGEDDRRRYLCVSDGEAASVRVGWRDIPVLRMRWRGRLRRFFIIHFRKGYVAQQLARRSGSCQMCGRCCCFRRCPFIVREGECHKCILHPYKPGNCTTYPIDRKDIEDYGCPGFRFLGKNDENAAAGVAQRRSAIC